MTSILPPAATAASEAASQRSDQSSLGGDDLGMRGRELGDEESQGAREGYRDESE